VYKRGLGYILLVFVLLMIPGTVEANSDLLVKWSTVDTVIRQGDRGAEVRLLQESLTALNYPVGPTDGIFGMQTFRAVQAYQKDKQILVDGVVGRQTASIIIKDLEQLVIKESTEKYTVRKGDTLSGIALRLGTSTTELIALNKLTNPEFIYVGQELLVPKKVIIAAEPAKPVKEEVSSKTPVTSPLPIIPSVTTEKKRIALTFNDGPDPELTERILQTLAIYGAKATFFVVGQDAQRYPDLIKAIANQGHQLENHSYTHRDLRSLSSAEIDEEILKTASIIKDLTGHETRYFRPPYATFNQNVLNGVSRTGHRILLWTNIAAVDYPFPGKDKLVKRLADTAYDGAIIMLHANIEETVAALPDILSELQRRGYTFITLDEIMQGR